MNIVTRVILQPRGGGEPVEIFDSDEGDVALEALLPAYLERFGEPLDLALTELPEADEPVTIGWVFPVPPAMEVPGASADFEMILIPMIDDESGDRVSAFVRLAEDRQLFEGLFEAGEIDRLTFVETDAAGGRPDPSPVIPEFRLPGFGGAALLLRPTVLRVVDPEGPTEALGFDVGLLSPDRLVHYLGRLPAGHDFLADLSAFFLQAAAATDPEESVGEFSDDGVGLTISIASSTTKRVELDVVVVALLGDIGDDDDDDDPELDGLNFETSRAALVTASHDLLALIVDAA